MDQNTNRRTKYQKNSSAQIVNRNTILLFALEKEKSVASLRISIEVLISKGLVLGSSTEDTIATVIIKRLWIPEQIQWLTIVTS